MRRTGGGEEGAFRRRRRRWQAKATAVTGFGAGSEDADSSTDGGTRGQYASAAAVKVRRANMAGNTSSVGTRRSRWIRRRHASSRATPGTDQDLERCCSSDGESSRARRWYSTDGGTAWTKQLRSTAGVEHGEGASDGRGGEHEFGGDADVHAGYDGGDAWGGAVERHGHGNVTGSPRLLERRALVLDRWRDDVDKSAAEGRWSSGRGDDFDVTRRR